jgi:hypothetical protein
MAYVHAHCSQTVHTAANENATNVAADRKMWRSLHEIQELRLSHISNLEVLLDNLLNPYHYSQNTHQFPDDLPLRITTIEYRVPFHADIYLENEMSQDICYIKSMPLFFKMESHYGELVHDLHFFTYNIAMYVH